MLLCHHHILYLPLMHLQLVNNNIKQTALVQYLHVSDLDMCSLIFLGPMKAELELESEITSPHSTSRSLSSKPGLYGQHICHTTMRLTIDNRESID